MSWSVPYMLFVGLDRASQHERRDVRAREGIKVDRQRRRWRPVLLSAKLVSSPMPSLVAPSPSASFEFAKQASERDFVAFFGIDRYPAFNEKRLRTRDPLIELARQLLRPS